MPKEILIYGPIWEYSAKELAEELEEAAGEAVTLRINTDGGEVSFGNSMLALLQEYKGEIEMVVDGIAASFGAMMLLFSKNVSALDVSNFLFHRASYGEWYEKSSYFTQANKDMLININANMEKAFRAKVDVAVFEEMKGIKVKDMFSTEKPQKETEVHLTAKEAKKIGLINSIVKLTPAISAEINSRIEKIADHKEGWKVAARIKEDEPQIEKPMTAEEFKAKHPEAYQSIHNAAFAAGKKAEKERVEAFMVFASVDADGVKKGIESGEPMTPKQMAEFALKAASIEKKNALAADGKEIAPAAGAGAAPQTPEASQKEKTQKEFMDEVKANMRIQNGLPKEAAAK